MSDRVPRGKREMDGDRELTEWFEQPDGNFDSMEEAAYAKACERMGVEERPKDRAEGARFHKFYIDALREKWNIFNGMNKQELAVRLNEAAKMTEEVKYLPDDVQDRTGLQMNPLWMMETLVRSGALKPSQQVSALKTLAEYTHSKTPSYSAHATTELTAEEWLKALAKDEYKIIDLDDGLPEVQRMETKEKKKPIIHEQRGRPSAGCLAQREARASYELDEDAVEAEFMEIVANGRETGNGSGSEET